MKTWEAQGKVCPFISGIGSSSSATPPQYTTTPAIGYPPPTAFASAVFVNCRGDHCAAWVGDSNDGRCGLIHVTDAEAMKMNLTGTL